MKTKTNMGLLVDAIDEDPGLLTLLQRSHLCEIQEVFLEKLCECFTSAMGLKNPPNGDIYSNLISHIRCVSMPG